MHALRERASGLCRHRCHLPRIRLPTCQSCCSSCTKIILVLVNFVFLVCGWLLVILGVWMHIRQDSHPYAYLLKDAAAVAPSHGGSSTGAAGGNSAGRGEAAGVGAAAAIAGDTTGRPTDAVLSLETVPFVLMGVGGFLASMSFLGCCGACAESVCFLGFYSLFTMMIIIAEIILGSLSSDFIDQTSIRLLKTMHHQVETRYNITAQRSNNTITDSYRVTVAWDSLQKELHCCGASGPYDYRRSSWFNHTKDDSGVYIPSTCCISPVADDSQTASAAEVASAMESSGAVGGTLGAEEVCQVEATLIRDTKRPMTSIYAQGCHEAVMRIVKRYEKIVISFLCVIILIQITNFVFACFLMTWVKKKHSDYSWCEKDDFE